MDTAKQDYSYYTDHVIVLRDLLGLDGYKIKKTTFYNLESEYEGDDESRPVLHAAFTTEDGKTLVVDTEAYAGNVVLGHVQNGLRYAYKYVGDNKTIAKLPITNSSELVIAFEPTEISAKDSITHFAQHPFNMTYLDNAYKIGLVKWGLIPLAKAIYDKNQKTIEAGEVKRKEEQIKKGKESLKKLEEELRLSKKKMAKEAKL